jgi:K+-sensing histidine kinase KdpD
MTSAIFQVESAIEDLWWKNFMKDKTLKELEELRTQLVRTGWLISKLFSVEYYDNHEVTLFREVIHFPKFLEYEIELFSRIHEEITFLSHVDQNIWFIAIDKVQFQQVITNLLDNAIKFAAKEDPLIYLSAAISDRKLILTVEDNGKGFSESSMKNVFEKYSTGSNKNVWLGLGLYLCKKIITLHNGSIVASNSKKYKWACFTITLYISVGN